MTTPHLRFPQSARLNQLQGRSKRFPTKTVFTPIFMLGMGDDSPADKNKAETTKAASPNEKLLGSRRLAAAREVFFQCTLNVTGTFCAVRHNVHIVMHHDPV